jgi:hypothetical protein
LIGAGALVLAWRLVPARALTWIAAEVRTAWPTAIAPIIASTVPLKVPSVIALAALWPVTPGRWPRPVVDRPRRRFGGFQPGLRQQRRQGLGLHALERAEVGHRQRGAVEVAQQSQPGLSLLLMPSLVGLQRRLLDPQLGLLGAQLGLLSPQFCLRSTQFGLLHVVWRLILRWRSVLSTGLRMGLCACLLLAVARDLASARQLLAGELAVFFAQFTRWLAVEVEALGGLAQRDQVSGAAGVAAEECRQRRLAEHPWRALCDV